MSHQFHFLYFIGVILSATLFACESPDQKTSGLSDKGLPNIILIYMDDLGYGDLGVYGAKGIPTPHFDKLAHEGLRFTKAYATSATCTPSRYGILTGVYPWRNENARILPGDAPLLIDTAMVTLPAMLRQMGYHTGVVGKWHLGLGIGKVDWNQQITPGPNEVGFDYSFIMAATQDRVPTVFIENGHVAHLDPNDPIEVSYVENFEGEPTGKDHPEMLKLHPSHGHDMSIVNGISRIGFMKGGESARWVDENMADTLLGKAEAYVKKHKNGPFFLYYAMRQPHVPRTPHPRFAGSTEHGPRGDVIVEADAMIGKFMKTLEEEGLTKNTLIIFSSDNGPVVDDGYEDQAVELLGDHQPRGPFRGGKYSLFEAGTRVPFITWWPGVIEPGVSDAMVSQLDLFASLADLAGNKQIFSGKDSEDHLETFLGKDNTGRKQLIQEASTRTAFRQGDWVMIPPYKGPAMNHYVNIELGNSTDYQLYDLSTDPGEQKNLAEKNPGKLEQMLRDFEAIRGKDYGNTKPLNLE